MIKHLLYGTAIVVMLTACGNKPETTRDTTVGQGQIIESVSISSAGKPNSNAEINFEKHLAFERKFTPIVEKALIEQFLDVSKFNAYGVYYIDDSDNDPKYVFLLDKPDVTEVKKLKKNLQNEMGDKVEFRLPKHSLEKLKGIEEEIGEKMLGMNLRGGWVVSTDIQKQIVMVEAHLTEEQKYQLIKEYGEDLVEIKISGVVSAMVGYVVKEKDGKILVVNPNVKNFGAQGGESYHYDASWYSNVPSNVKVGQKVEVKVIEGLTTMQYPGDDTAEEVIIIPNTKPKNAILTEEEAIRKALASNEFQQSIATTRWLPVVKEIKYDVEQSLWIISFTSEGTAKVLPIQVEDK